VFAIKELRKDFIQRHDKVESVMREKDVMYLCDHRNILKLECCFADEVNLYFLTEYLANGSLNAVTKQAKLIPIETCRYWVAEIVLALEYLAMENIAHRDLKPDNILLDDHFHIKICDFGEAKIITDIDEEQMQRDFKSQQEKQKKQFAYQELDDSEEDVPEVIVDENYDEPANSFFNLSTHEYEDED